MSSSNRALARLREYRADDFARLWELDQMCFPEGIAYTPDEIALGLLQPGAFALVAEVEDRVVAFVLTTQHRRPTGHIVTIDVHPEFRRQRIGERLMDLAEQRLKRQGAQRVILEASTGNAPALAFYRQRGYLNKRLLPNYYRGGSDASLMEKTLS